jgi:hypothetical protein
VAVLGVRPVVPKEMVLTLVAYVAFARTLIVPDWLKNNFPSVTLIANSPTARLLVVGVLPVVVLLNSMIGV